MRMLCSSPHTACLQCCHKVMWSFEPLKVAPVCTVTAPASRVSCCGVCTLDAACRLFAVGYAARHVSSSQQLLRLLSNPPAPAALRVEPTDWATHHLEINVPEGLLCGACGAQLATAVSSEAPLQSPHVAQLPAAVCCTVGVATIQRFSSTPMLLSFCLVLPRRNTKSCLCVPAAAGSVAAPTVWNGTSHLQPASQTLRHW